MLLERVLVTGANGFVGAALVEALQRAGIAVRGAFRSERSAQGFDGERVIFGEIAEDTDWSEALDGVTAVAHLAGPAHAQFQETIIRSAIVGGTSALAEQAERAGVGRFVFVSSIKAVAGRSTGIAVSEAAEPAPEDAYGRAKLAAEREVLALPALRPVVLRPPLVCAPDARANFARLLKLADTPWPLPLGGLQGRRNVIGRESLVAVLVSVFAASDGPAGVFHVANQPALSAAQMISAVRRGLGRSANVFGLPGADIALPRQLVESLEVDDAAFRRAYSYGAHDPRADDMLAAVAAAWKAAQ